MEPPVALLFTGHMIDLPGRSQARFPPDRETAAAIWIGKKVEAASQGKAPMGFCSGARGGDILFLEACLRQHIETYIVLPFEPEVFVGTSVTGAATGDWEKRFWHIWSATPEHRREILRLEISGAAYEACNARLLELARHYGTVHLIALWDGKYGGGPGGAAHLVKETRGLGGIVETVAPLSLGC
ncbi:hypothetical protein DBIPINDM_001874 [Mesorhizobium sp. AR02]|uniref:hypothetical protein n=1 Tax=Mesorhizobium sp. AR02 TaxID=2865837 RepID=UPI00215E78B4|nr:hypothetical protein [Mesorhizobium sp. AR02]UVK55366.1 hypothetical protein DBIPINDM_001874 [Mesorhizobium sp. AR02]